MARRSQPHEAAAVDDAGGVLALLRASGGRVTPARRMIVDALFRHGGHCTAEELAAEIRESAPDLHRSTVYRNLDELERIGVVEHVHLGHGPATYHLASEHHGHFVCGTCGAVFEAPDAAFVGLADVARRELGFEIDPHHFGVLGTCATCAKAR